MATHLLGTNANNTLTAVQWTPSISDADLATINQLIADDQALISSQLGPSAATIQAGIVMSGTTSNGTNTITTTTVSSPTGALLSGLAGSYLYGLNIGIPAGTRVASVSGTTVTMTANAGAAAGTGTFFAIGKILPNQFQRQGLLWIPNRTLGGPISLLPGDYVGVGPAGEVVILPKQAIAYSGSGWTFV